MVAIEKVSCVLLLSWFLVICCTPAFHWNMCTVLRVSSFTSAKHYSICFWWVTPSTTEQEQIVLIYSWHWKKKEIILFSEELWSAFCLRQMQSEKVEHLCSRLQLPRMDLQSYRVGGCWQCSTWSLLSLLWQRTGPDHWRWWGGLAKSDRTRVRDKEDKQT